MTLEDYSRNAIAKFNARHEFADSLLFNSAGFYWDLTIEKFVVTVRDYVVAELATLPETLDFVGAHNARLQEVAS